MVEGFYLPRQKSGPAQLSGFTPPARRLYSHITAIMTNLVYGPTFDI